MYSYLDISIHVGLLVTHEIKRTCASVGKVFLMIKIGPVFMDSIVYSLIKLWWQQAQDR
jgi:uncharacterized membrane protein AbrB (regulator of aidB expression)